MSGVRRPRKPRAPRTTAPRGIYRGTLAAGGDLEAAAEIIADEARRLAEPWARTGATVDSIHTERADERTVLVVADSGAAYPNETNATHPLFARGEDRSKWTWRDKEGRPFRNHRPFMGPAAEAKAADAMKRYAEKIDRLLEKAGFR